MFYGLQNECSNLHLRRCVAVEPYVPTTLSTTVNNELTVDEHPTDGLTNQASSTNIFHTHTPNPTAMSTSVSMFHHKPLHSSPILAHSPTSDLQFQQASIIPSTTLPYCETEFTA